MITWKIPGAGKVRRRAASVTEERVQAHDRYVSIGGFIDIQTLTKRNVVTKSEYAEATSLLTPQLSSPSTGTWSVAKEWNSLPSSPQRSEGLSPQTPQVPPEQTGFTNMQTRGTLLVSRYNRSNSKLNLSRHVVAFEHPLRDAGGDITSFMPQRVPSIELPGSLLLPSQGFPQSNPPIVPTRLPLPGTSHSTQIGTVLPQTDTLPSTTINMAKRSHQHSDSRSLSTSAQQTQCAPPPRISSLPPKAAPPQQPHPPTPLSQMMMEELMQILPKLDAAVIAHDWMPCMQKRQQELKDWLQRSSANPDTEESERCLDKDLRRIIDESKDIAKTYYKLFGVAKELQNEDLQKKANELDEAHAQRSEAMIALARHVSMHNDQCEQYHREMEEVKDKAAQSIDVLSHFIHQNLDEAMQNAPQEQIEEVLHTLVEMRSGNNYSSSHVRSDLYQDLQHELKKSNDERDGLRAVCSQQMATIHEQSKGLDQYIVRMAKIMDIVQDKECQNQKLREELAEVKIQHRAHEDVAQVKMQKQEHHEQKGSPAREIRSDALQRSLVNEVWKRDAEITNLRRKLDKTYTQETELQAQIRRLLLSSQCDHSDKQPSRLKRLLTGQQKSSPSIPTLNSMQNLSQSVFTQFNKEKPRSQQAPSPSRSGRSSPSLGAFCEPVSNLDHLELPAADKTHQREGSSPSIPPRMREAVTYPQDDIDFAVSGRFHQMPSNVRSAVSSPRPHTPKSSSTSSHEEISDYRQGRPRFHSDPGVQEHCASSDNVADERQPLMTHNRVLSGITEVTEDGGSFKRKSSSPDSSDKRMYLDSMHAARALGGLQIG